jgi:hypothetical protein
MTYNPNKYRALGVGEKIEPGDMMQTNDGVMPAGNGWYGLIVPDDAELTFLRPLPTPGAQAIDALAQEAGITTEIGRKALAVAVENIKLLDRKQRDYGSGNIAAFGEYGVLVRTFDKISRLRNLLTNVKDPANESVMDSWVDLGNYAIIAQICRKGEWR